MNDDCAICIDEMKEFTILKCKHKFHKKCIKQLIANSNDLYFVNGLEKFVIYTCPLCRQVYSEPIKNVYKFDKYIICLIIIILALLTIVSIIIGIHFNVKK